VKPLSLFSTALLTFLAFTAVRAEPGLRDFITVRGDQLMEGDKPFHFISFDLPNLQMIEDNMPFTETNPWRLPDEFEIRDGLMTVRQMGGTVVRTYVLSVMRTNDPPGKFNEEAFRELDLVLQVANEQGVRLIIPLVDNWKWQGGRAEYAGFRGKDRDDFWTDRQLIEDFKQTIHFLVLRTNTLTGVRYCDDKAILCWETGNEISPTTEWTREIARYIKSLDTNHLVMDGRAWQLQPELLAIPEIDIVTTHHYPNSRRTTPFAQLIQENAAMAKGKKPYVVGEFGFVPTEQMAAAMQAIIDTGISGGLLWSLRFRDRDGGFYWHSEPSGGNLYKGFHWPGSTNGAAYDEINLMASVRQYAFAIRGLTPPTIPVPAPPRLLPITDAAAISWQGSVSAASYTAERAPKADGPWTMAGTNIDESFAQYRPLFNDESVPKGNWYYRVRAKNEAGFSKPSNVVGPVAVTHATLVDELADFSKVHARQGQIGITTRNGRRAKEDAHRAAGNAGDALIYELPTSIEGFRIFTLFPNNIVDLKCSISDDGQTYHDVHVSKNEYFGGAGDYGFWEPVLYHAENIGGGAKFLKIELTSETQIGRVEIIHALESK
jgi:hypothetical protein